MSYPPKGPPPYFAQPPLSGNNPSPHRPEHQHPHHHPPHPHHHPPHPHHHPPHPHHHPPHPHHHTPHPHPQYPYYVPGTVMMPVPVMPMPSMPMPPMPGPSPPESQPTYITNYIYHGESSNQSDKVQIAEIGGDFNWVPTTTTTAGHLSGKAVLGGNEGWDGSPLWVIRAWHNGDLIPGKLSVRHKSASVMYNGKEIPVQNIEVLCSKPDSLRWVPASDGNVPPGAIPGGKTASGEVLYVGRARHQLSITPGKVHPSHNCCYIAFGGSEVSHKMYDVLCRLS